MEGGDGRGGREAKGGREGLKRWGGGEGHHVKLTKARKSCLFSPHRNPNYPDNKSEVGGRERIGRNEEKRRGRGNEKKRRWKR